MSLPGQIEFQENLAFSTNHNFCPFRVAGCQFEVLHYKVLIFIVYLINIFVLSLKPFMEYRSTSKTIQ